jgi:hypothetical protein
MSLRFFLYVYAEDWTQGLPHADHALCLWAIPLAPRNNLMEAEQGAERPLETILVIRKIVTETWTMIVKKEIEKRR